MANSQQLTDELRNQLTTIMREIFKSLQRGHYLDGRVSREEISLEFDLKSKNFTAEFLQKIPELSEAKIDMGNTTLCWHPHEKKSEVTLIFWPEMHTQDMEISDQTLLYIAEILLRAFAEQMVRMVDKQREDELACA